MSDSTPLWLPPAMVQRAREFRGPPAPVRAAATVVLIRPAGQTFEVYVLKRVTTMAFGGVYALNRLTPAFSRAGRDPRLPVYRSAARPASAAAPC